MTDQATAEAGPEDPKAAHAEEPPSDQPPDATTDGAPAEDDLGQDSERFRQFGQNINNFFGTTDARGSVFGIQRTSARRATGNVSITELAERLAHFVRPEPFDKAKQTLAEQHFVLLCGQNGIGKPTGALAVATAVVGQDKPITRLAPSYSLADLVDYPRFKSGRAYLVQDWTIGTISSAVQRFDVDLLQRKLRQADAFLLITTGMEVLSCESLSGFAVRWAPPDPMAIFEELLPTVDVSLDEAQRAAALERIGRLRRPSDVTAVVARLGQGVDAAFEVLDDVDKIRVADWFGNKPDARALLSLAAVCFLSGTPESVFQQHLSRLVQIVEQHNPGATASSAHNAGDDAGDRIAFPQRGATTDDSLDEVTRETYDGDVGSTDRCRRFKSARYREFAVAELANRYGFELWGPLREWINELAVQPASPTQVRLALGMALYARHSPNDVEYSFLETWADGGLSERLTAAYLLSWMCVDKALAASALRSAVNWVRNAGQRRAATAALAFGGELGMRFPSEALSWLWYLAMRGEAVSRVARSSMGELCCAAADDPESVATVLNYLSAALRRLIDDGSGRPEHGRFSSHLRKATSTVYEVLTARPLGSAESVTALILRTLPDNAECLGQLWSEVLRSWSHRSDAIDELIRMLDVMRTDDTSKRVIGKFGTAVRARLTSEEIRLLRDDMDHRLANSETQAAPLASVLLAALERGAGK
jgi:hypothetical protein